MGWGGLADAFDKDKREWSGEYKELEAALTPEEYAAARGSTLNAHYTSPTVIKAIYDALGSMGFQTGNVLEPAMGVGNFFGMLPEEMRSSRLYGVELDSISGRIAKQLYPQANITVAGFETTDRKDFFDVAANLPSCGLGYGMLEAFTEDDLYDAEQIIPIDKQIEELCDRDKWMKPEEAIKMGFLDAVIERKE